MSDVKRSRRDRSDTTRRKILHAAHDEFIEKGFHGATIASIATRAGVAPQTVYFVFHNKIDLMSAVIDNAVLGEEQPTVPQEADWWRAAFDEPDAAEALRTVVRGSGPIFARASVVKAVLRAASLTDEELGRLWDFHEALRAEAFRDVIRMLASKGRLKGGLDEDTATDLFLTLYGDTTYHLMTVDRKWPHDRFIEWLSDALPQLLLETD